MDEYQQAAAQSQGSGKKNKRKKKNKDQTTADHSDTLSRSQGGGNNSSSGAAAPKDSGASPLASRGEGKKGQLPKPGSFPQQRGQLVVNVSGGNRTVAQPQTPESRSAQKKFDAQQGRKGSVESNTNSNANSGKQNNRGKGKGDRKGERLNKPQQQQEQQQQDSPSSKGKFVTLEGKELLRELADHRIFELKKKNLSFPNAKYFCRLCEYHLDRPQDCERHVDESRHRRKKEACDMEGILEHIPKPPLQQIKALDAVVESVTEQEGVCAEELETLQNIVCRLQTFIHSYREDVKLQLYGSSLSGCGLRQSDVNVDVSGSGPTPSILTSVFNILREKGEPGFVNVQSDYNAKIPVVRLTDNETGRQVVLAINSQAPVLTSKLLRLYSLADPRVKQLAVTLRNWAKICHLDRQDEGTLPPFAFSIMVVYFLQQIQPPILGLLPVPKTQAEGKGTSPTKMEDRIDFDFLKTQAEAWKPENKCSIGELWLQLLKFYCLDFDNTQFVVSILQTEPLTRHEKKWHSKKLAIEDPFSPKKNIASSMANTLIFEYFQSCLRKAYEYFGMPRDLQGNVSISIQALKALASKKTDSLLKENQDPSSSSSSASQSDKDSPQKEVAGNQRKDEKNNNAGEKEGSMSDQTDDDGEPVVIQPNSSISMKLYTAAGAIGDTKTGTSAECDVTVSSASEPSASDENMTSNSGTQVEGRDCETSAISSVSDVTSDSVPAQSASDLDFTTDSVSGFSTSDCYVTASEMDVTTDSIADGSFMSAQNISAVFKHTSKSLGVDPTSEKPGDGENETSPGISQTTGDGSDNEIDSSINTSQTAAPVDKVSEMFENLHTSQEKTGQTLETRSHTYQNGQEMALQYLDEKDTDWYNYKFSEDVFTSGKGPAVICGYCEQEGHIKANCPDDQLPQVQPLPKMTPDHLNIMDRVITNIIFDFSPSEIQVQQRNRLVRDLESFVRQIYPDACFSLFGSSCNGFGFYSSDLDICMTFRGKKVEDIDVVEIIETVAVKLMQRGKLYNVIAIPTAKVPIVKFTDRETRLEGDISLYNTLAQRNTRLLWCYSEIDPRVKVLGYAVKVFAKVCDIGDASRGSLSSYGYILMMLHYLQQCRPPVIPILQELRPEGEWPENMVEGCNTWFFDDLRHLRHVWRERQNSQTIGELWLGFLRYYLEDFDWKGMVVSIRQKTRLTKFEKMWTGKTIAVEDPFDLNHNLGGGLSRKMNNYIYKAFVLGRMHFGTPIEYNMELYSRHRSPSDYFFDVELLTDGKPPNDRGCRMCGKIGHLVKDCPNRSGNRRRQQPQKEKEGKQKNNQSEKGQGRREIKGQNTEPKGQGNDQAKGQGESKGQGSGQTKTQEEGKKGKSQEKQKGQGGTPAKGIEDARGQGNGQVKAQGGSKESHSKVDAQGDNAAGSINVGHKIPLVFEAKSVLATTVGSPTTNTTTTTTAATTPATTTTTASRHSTPGVPPGLGFASERPPSHPELSSQQAASPSSMFGGSELPSSPQTSTPLRTAKPGMHPPGVQMDLQQLFSMVQQASNSPVSLSQQLQPRPGLHPSQLCLTPEQQVAMFRGQSLMQGPSSPGSPQQLGPRSPPGKGVSETKMAPVPLMSLFHSQSPTSSAHQAQAAGSPQQGNAAPLKPFFPSHSQSQQAAGGSPGRAGSETVYTSQQMMPLPVKALFQPPVSLQQQQQQQMLLQQQFMQTLMQRVPGFNRSPAGPHVQQQQQPVSSQHPPVISVSHPGQSVSSQNQPPSPHQQMSFPQRQRQPVSSPHHQNQPPPQQQPVQPPNLHLSQGQLGGVLHQGQPAGLVSQQSPPLVSQSQPLMMQHPHSQASSTQAQPISPQQQQQMAFLQQQQQFLQQHMQPAAAFCQAPPGIHTPPVLGGMPIFQMPPAGAQNSKRDGSSSSTDTTGHGSPHGNP